MFGSHTTVGQMAPVASEYARAAVETHLTSTLRQKAAEAGWSTKATAGLYVQHSFESGFQINVHDSVQDHVMDLEYGTSEKAPSAVLRQFHSRMHLHADQAATDALMVKAGVLL